MMLRKKPGDSSYGPNDDIDEVIDGRRTFSVEEKLKLDCWNDNHVQILTGEDLNYALFQEKGFDKPILIKEKLGLDLRVPAPDFTVDDVMRYVGDERTLEVINTITQSSETWSMKDFVKYYNTPKEQRKKVYNVISLEFTGTPLDPLVRSPAVVREMDWVQRAWPLEHLYIDFEDLEDDEVTFPKVLKYCLMSVAGCYTDFHIDLGGTSVWYHIIRGQKMFWLIPPTQENINAYEKWSLSGEQESIFLADKCSSCQLVTLDAGNTFFIPTGWIHAVYTSKDSLVFGGNFLHSFNIGLQLRIAGLEETLKVPAKYRYPYFTEIQWYVYDHYNIALTGKSCMMTSDGQSIAEQCKTVVSNPVLSKYELQGLRNLREWLPNQPIESLPEELDDRDLLLESMMVCLVAHNIDDKKKTNPVGKSLLQWKDDVLAEYKSLVTLHDITQSTPSSLTKEKKKLKNDNELLSNNSVESGHTGLQTVKKRNWDEISDSSKNNSMSDISDEGETKVKDESKHIEKEVLSPLAKKIRTSSSESQNRPQGSGSSRSSQVGLEEEAETASTDTVYLNEKHKKMLDDLGEGRDLSSDQFQTQYNLTKSHLETILSSSTTSRLIINGSSVVVYKVPDRDPEEIRVFVIGARNKSKTSKTSAQIPPKDVEKETTPIKPKVQSTSAIQKVNGAKIVDNLELYLKEVSASMKKKNVCREKIAFLSLSQAIDDNLEDIYFGHILAVDSSHYLHLTATKPGVKQVSVSQNDLEVNLPLVFAKPADIPLFQAVKKKQIGAKMVSIEEDSSLNESDSKNDSTVVLQQVEIDGKTYYSPASLEQPSLEKTNHVANYEVDKNKQVINILPAISNQGDIHSSPVTVKRVMGDATAKPIQLPLTVDSLNCDASDTTDSDLLGNHLIYTANEVISLDSSTEPQKINESREMDYFGYSSDDDSNLSSNMAAETAEVLSSSTDFTALSNVKHLHGYKVIAGNITKPRSSSEDQPDVAVFTIDNFFTPPKSSNNKKANKNEALSSSKKRRANCGGCVACQAVDCGECAHCLDKPKFGGPGKMKQRCAKKKCLNRGSLVSDKPNRGSLVLDTARLKQKHLESVLAVSSSVVSVEEPETVLPDVDDCNSVDSSAVDSIPPDSKITVDPPEEKETKSVPGYVIQEEISRIRKQDNCGVCEMCLDKPQFGGPNKKKQMCLKKKNQIKAYLEEVRNSDDEDDQEQIRSSTRKRKLTSKMEESLVQEWYDKVRQALPNQQSEKVLLNDVENYLRSVTRESYEEIDEKTVVKDAEEELDGAVLHDLMDEMDEIMGDEIACLTDGIIKNQSQGSKPETMSEHWALYDEDVLIDIFKYLSPPDLLNCSLVCKAWRTASKHRYLWKVIDLTKRTIDSNVAESVSQLQPEILTLNKAITSPIALQSLLINLAFCTTLCLKGVTAVVKVPLNSIPVTVERLDLSANSDLGDSEFSTFFVRSSKLTSLTTLTHLDLSQTKVGDNALKLISSYLPRIKSLLLNGCNRVTNNGFKVVASSVHASLRRLDMTGCETLDSQCLQNLNASTKGFCQLKSLNLNGCTKVSVQDLKTFMASLQTPGRAPWKLSRRHMSRNI